MYFRLFLSSIKRKNIFIQRHFRCNTLQLKKVELKEAVIENPEEPIKFSTSGAAKWTAVQSTCGDYYEIPRIQPTCVATSLAVFMIYFCILREENDLDDWLREIETNVPIQMEEMQLRSDINYGKSKHIDVSWMEARLEKIKEDRLKKSKTE